MFDVGFTELFLISVIALIVIGPERLPSAARTAGAWLGRMKRTFNTVKYDVQRELQAEELRKSILGEQEGELKDFGKALTEDILGTNTPNQTTPAEPQKPNFEGRYDENGEWVAPWVDDPDSAPPSISIDEPAPADNKKDDKPA